jgi:heme o synthase
MFVAITAVAGYALAAGAAMNATAIILVTLTTMAMSGGAAALNQLAERREDALMRRTANRPLPSGIVSSASAAMFGWTLSIAGAALALVTLPPLTVVFLALCHVSYVFAYTPMKKRTINCTLVGAIPGSVPVLAGAAAAGGLPTPAVLALTGMLFMWQMPHFFAIGWLTRADYARAGFAMLPVVDASGAATARACLLYAIAMQGLAILTTREMGAGPATMAIVHTAGTAYVLAVLPFMRGRTNARARRLFFTSLVVLPVILCALMTDALLR